MKLAPRMTLTLSLAAVVLFGISGHLLLKAEARELRTVAEAQAMLLARSLQIAVENALRDAQTEDVSEIIDGAAEESPDVSIYLFAADGTLWLQSKGALFSRSSAALAQQLPTDGRALVDQHDLEDSQTLRIALPLSGDAAPHANILVVRKGLDVQAQDLVSTRRLVISAVSLFVFAVAALTWWMTRYSVSLPLQRMIDDMARVQKGDLQLSPDQLRDDEVGEARQAFEALVAALKQARIEAETATEARLRLERDLQHADKLITLGQLAAQLAHEIGSPLQVLHGRARALLKQVHRPEAAERTANILVSQTERITHIVSQMLTLTRRRRPQPEPITAAPAIQAVLDLLGPDARQRGLKLRAEPHGDDRLYADANSLQQVVLNLVRNALDASPPGGLVRVRHGGDGARHCLEVLDQGQGVPEAERAHLFEPFYTTRDAQGGTGLGLPVVRSIVQAHHGELQWLDAKGGGTRIVVSLPREPTDPLDLTEASPARPQDQST